MKEDNDKLIRQHFGELEESIFKYKFSSLYKSNYLKYLKRAINRKNENEILTPPSIWMHDIGYGMSFSEIGRKMNLPAYKVRSIYVKAIEKIKAKLENYYV